MLDQGAHFGLWHSTSKFPHKVALVICGHAFRLRRLAQSVRLRSGPNLGRGIFPLNFHIKWLKVCVSVFWAQSGLWQFACKFPSKVALVKS